MVERRDSPARRPCILHASFTGLGAGTWTSKLVWQTADVDPMITGSWSSAYAVTPTWPTNANVEWNSGDLSWSPALTMFWVRVGLLVNSTTAGASAVVQVRVSGRA